MKSKGTKNARYLIDIGNDEYQCKCKQKFKMHESEHDNMHE